MGIPDHLTCLLKNGYAGQEATVRTGHGTANQERSTNQERSSSRLCIVTLLILFLCRIHHEKYWLDEAQAGIKNAGRNINNLRYADDTTLKAENEEELKSLLMKVKEESEKVGSTFRKLRSWHLVPSLHDKQMGNCERLIFLGSKITADGDCSHKMCLLLGRKVMES